MRRGGWNVSTNSRILKDEQYTGKIVWNRTTTLKHPLSGKMRQCERPTEVGILLAARRVSPHVHSSQGPRASFYRDWRLVRDTAQDEFFTFDAVPERDVLARDASHKRFHRWKYGRASVERGMRVFGSKQACHRAPYGAAPNASGGEL